MVDRFDGLRHDTIISGNNQNYQIGDFGTAGTHCCKSLMTRCIQKNDLAFIRGNIVGSNVLGNSSGFIFGNIGFTDYIQQRCLTMIDMSHNGNHRRPLDELGRVIFFHL